MGPERRLAVLTSGRQDWGILRSTCHALRDAPDFELILLAGGMHLAPGFGHTVDRLATDGCPPTARLPWLGEQPDTLPPWRAAGQALQQVGDALASLQPEALMLVGDRYETLAAAQAATLLGLPLIHLHGGEETAGAMDNAMRHALSKLSHLHLVSHTAYGDRLVAMGEPAATVHVVGAPGLDNLRRADLPDRTALAERLGLPLVPPVVLVTVHPTTSAVDPIADAVAVAAAMDRVPATYVVTLPNADPGHQEVRRIMQAAASTTGGIAVDALGEDGYWGLMRVATAVLGNSSSALIEAPALALPAVNVGERQTGRLRAPSVVDVAPDPAAVADALRRVLAPSWRERLQQAPSPFGDGRAAERILAILRQWQPPPGGAKSWQHL